MRDAAANFDHFPLADVLAVAADLRRFDRPWWVAGGWAIDLFLGRVTRAHGDLEVGVWRDDQAPLRAHWSACAWEVSVDGAWRPWAAGARVDLPAFQLRVRSPTGGRDVEIFLNDATPDGAFACRRDDRIRLPTDQLVVPTPFDVPALAPEVQLLYKAKHARPKDEQDFANVVPLLSADRVRWLVGGLRLLDPAHPWVARLDHTCA